MRQARYLAIFVVFAGSGLAMAQTPDKLYTWDDHTVQDWQVWGVNVPGTGTNKATVSAASGDLVVTEIGDGTPSGGVVGGSLWIFDGFDRPRENWLAVKGNLDVTGLQYIEMDIRHNSPTATVPVDFFMVSYINNQPTTIASGPAWSIGPGLNTIKFPLNLLSSRLQGSIKNVFIQPEAHTAVGNLTWTISEVRSVGTPLAYRDIVTNDAGTPDDGLDGAFPLNTSDMLAIVGNDGTVSQLGLSRNAAGSGSLQWTDKGGTGAVGSESGASIGWGNGGGWRGAVPGNPSSGNSYYERMSDFSNYDRMTVRISAQDLVSPSGSVAIGGVFIQDEANSIGTTLPELNLTTDGQYHDLVFDLSSVSFLRTLQHWGIDVAPHANNILFNIDNIKLWNSTTPVGVPGDYNGNGVVDAADYVLWRNGGALQNEGVTPGSNTPEDYTYWRSRFGATSGSGATVAAAVPEPSAVMLVLAGICGTFWRRRSRLQAA
jgi:hypothetical protein